MLGLVLKRWVYRLRHWVRNRNRNRNQGSLQALLHCWKSSSGLAGSNWLDVEFLVVDAEMSSLSVSDGELLSVGWVVIRKGVVELGSARHLLLRPESSVGDSATIHQLRDCELVEGLERNEALIQLLAAARGRVLVFHHATLDLAFLNRLSHELFGVPLLLPVIDTLQLEKQVLERRNIPLGNSVLRLGSCRARYNLPDYPAHNALMDALATAELFLAQVVHKGGKINVRDLLSSHFF